MRDLNPQNFIPADPNFSVLSSADVFLLYEKLHNLSPFACEVRFAANVFSGLIIKGICCCGPT